MPIRNLYLTSLIFVIGCGGILGGNRFSLCTVRNSNPTSGNGFIFHYDSKFESGESLEGEEVTIQIVETNEAVLDVSKKIGRLGKNGDIEVEYKYNKEDIGKDVLIEITIPGRDIKDYYRFKLEP